MTSMHDAAAMLFVLHDEDREWIMSKLPEGHRATVEQQLADLSELGFVRGNVAMDPLGDGDDIGAVPPTVPQDELATLKSASCEAVWRVVASEPDALIARLIRAQPWPWANDLMCRMSAEKREQLQRMGGQLPPAPALDLAVAGEVNTRLAGLEDETLRPPGHTFADLVGLASQMLQKLRGWRWTR